MKTFLFIFLSVFLNVDMSEAQEFNLSIEGGSGAGTYQKGSKIHVWSDKAATDEAFINWTGTAAKYLANVEEWHTTLKVPITESLNDLDLVANYESFDLEMGSIDYQQFGELNEDGIFFPFTKTIHYATRTSSSNLGIVFLFHGTGGNGESWFTRFERQSLVKDLAFRGYAVFALSSNETDQGDQNGDGGIRWQIDMSKQDIATNIDLLNVETTREQVIQDFGLEGLDVFLIGGSNGANFSDFCTASLDYKATAHMTGNGQFAVFQNHSNLKPIIWLQAKNDNNQSADSLRAMQNFHTLIDQEICTEWHWQERSPIYPQRFTRTYGGINNAMSESIFEKLVAQDYLDENNYLKIDNINMDFPFDNFIEEFNLSSQAKRDVLDQLNAANADHGAFSDFNKTIIDFFESLCGVNPIRERDKLLNQIRIYPNPTKGTVHFKSYEEPDIVIFDLSGRFILERSKVEVIDLGGLSSGVYIIEIKSGDSVFYTKLIIE